MKGLFQRGVWISYLCFSQFENTGNSLKTNMIYCINKPSVKAFRMFLPAMSLLL